jgi:signal transduction histidine kinase
MRKGTTEAVGKRVGLVALYLVAAAVGRASVVDGDPMALVWPAGGLAVAWLVTRPSRREWIVDIPLLITVGLAANLIHGPGVVTTGLLAISSVVAVLTVVLTLGWWSPTTVGRGEPPTSSPRDMVVFLAATVAGSFAGVAIGALGYLLAGRDLSVAGLVVWFGRNVCGMAAVGVTALLIVERIAARRTGRAGARTPELVTLFASTGALVVIDRLTVLPVSFLLPAAAVWAGSRFAALPVAVHAMFGGAGILWLTYVGEGPFAHLGHERLNILLAQLFIAMTLTIGLMLAAARQARAALSQELTTFARRAAHDLRNPLSVVESWTRELASALASDPRGRPAGTAVMIAGIEKATAQMRSLVDALLADAAASDREPVQVEVDLPDLVAEVASGYGAAGQVRTIGVPSVAGDPVLLRQLLDNLVANAVKYVRPGEQPEITISSHRTRDRVVVRVIDNGIGIPPGANEWIFEPFRRAHEDAYPGTGLGLSTCRRIVERHGGSMRALPREDGPGSVFEFDLPQAFALA